MERPLVVQAVPVAAAPFSSIVTAPGYLVSRQQAEIGPEMSGRITGISVEVGQSVQPGELIAELDDTSARAAIQSAHARQTSAAARLVLAENTFKAAQDSMSRASVTFARRRALHEAGTISDSDLAMAQDALAGAEANFSSAQSGLVTAEADITVAVAGVSDAEAAYGRTQLTAPFAGVVTAVHVSVGDVLAAGTPVISLADPGQLAIEVRLDEQALASLQIGQPASVTFRAAAGHIEQARVASIERRLVPDTRQAKALLTLQSIPSAWAIGQRADVTIKTGSSIAIAVPTSMVQWDGEDAFVFVSTADRAERRAIRLGEVGGDAVAVTAGLEPGDVVIDGDGLRRWRRVEVSGP